MDTTSATISRVLHILASNPKVQSRLRQEIVAARKEQGDLQSDALDHLPYLDAVCRESLRLYVPVFFISSSIAVLIHIRVI